MKWLKTLMKEIINNKNITKFYIGYEGDVEMGVYTKDDIEHILQTYGEKAKGKAIYEGYIELKRKKESQ